MDCNAGFQKPYQKEAKRISAHKTIPCSRNTVGNEFFLHQSLHICKIIRNFAPEFAYIYVLWLINIPQLNN